MQDSNSLGELGRVVAIGGGHGLGRVLKSLAYLGPKLSGIVTTTDNGGSTGRLRDSTDCIAWGDLRNCLSQLCPHATLNSVLLEYRFSDGDELAGHSLGNLMLYAMDQMSVRPLETIRLVSQMLGVDTELLPMSESPTHMLALDADGNAVWGELAVDKLHASPRELTLSPRVVATPEAVGRLGEADMILLGPGSFYTSVLPPLLLHELAGAIATSRACVVWIDNLKAESSAADTLDRQGRLDLVTRQLNGRAMDICLFHSELCVAQDNLLGRPLLAEPSDGLHDPQLLRQALDDAYHYWRANMLEDKRQSS